MNIADKFTLSRIVLAPVFFLVYFIPLWTDVGQVTSVFIMIPLLGFMEFTDYLDGHYARKLHEVSDFGKLFDPFADVLVHLTTFFCFVVAGYIPALIFVLILYREFGMNFVRLIAVQRGTAIAARKGGKLKTVLYVITGFYYLAIEGAVRLHFDVSAIYTILQYIGLFLCVLCVLLSYISFIDYLRHFKKILKK